MELPTADLVDTTWKTINSDIIDSVLSRVTKLPTQITSGSNCAICEWVLPTKRIVMYIKNTDANIFVRSTFIMTEKTGSHSEMIDFVNQHLR